MQRSELRQQHGFACEECRRRKARCDRVRPRCGSCTENGVQQCIIVTKRPQRGPKKGQLEMMRSRIAKLEWELGRQLSGDMEPVAESPSGTEDTELAAAIAGPFVTGLEQNTHTDMPLMHDTGTARVAGLSQRSPPWPPTTITGMIEPSSAIAPTEKFGFDCGLTSPVAAMNMVMDEHLGFGSITPLLLPPDVDVSPLVLADLDDVYFDRAHNIYPMVHQRRYFAWASESHPSPARACLRSAMRTLAAAMSAPYRSLASVLYAETCRLLEESKPSSGAEASWVTVQDKMQLEYIQAWLLVAHYECLRTNENQAMLSAGRAFRLVQMARLHNVGSDGGGSGGGSGGRSFAETEEKRRTFWVAYTLDCFLCWRNEWPLTLYEDVVGTHLPAPEANFLSGQAVRTSSLDEALAGHLAAPALSPFAECAVLATLHSRCMAQRSAARRNRERDSDAAGVGADRARARGLEAVEFRLQQLGWGWGGTESGGLGAEPAWTRAPAWAPAIERDPMVLFTHVLAHSIVVSLGTTLPQQPVYEQRALRAVVDMARLMQQAVPSLNCFKAHAFLPNPLATAVAFLQAQAAPSQDARAARDTLLRVLRDLRDVNSLAFDICLTDLDYTSR